MQKTCYSIFLFGFSLLLGGCGAGIYNSAPAYIPMFTNRTEASGNLYAASDGVTLQGGLGFLNYFGVYGGGHAVLSWGDILTMSNNANNAFAFGGIMGRYKASLGKHSSLLTELMVDYGIGAGEFDYRYYTRDYRNLYEKSNFNPLNIQINLGYKWRGLVVGVACKNVLLNFKNYTSGYNQSVNNYYWNSYPDKTSSFAQFIVEPNIFLRAGGENVAFLLDFRWTRLLNTSPLNSNSYLLSNHDVSSIYQNLQITIGIQFLFSDF